MSTAALTKEDCRDLIPRMFAVNHAVQEKLLPQIAAWLDPTDSGTFHYWDLTKTQMPELHFHDFDEYWIWSKGRTMLTLRLPDGRSDTFEIGPGWIVYCVRGVEHAHKPLEDWACYECISTVRPGTRPGHLLRACLKSHPV
jgi:mannose-6-phosphate isomerase-like protein (cupin superfamily)